MKSKTRILIPLLCILSYCVQTQNIVLDSSLENHNSFGCDYNNTDISFNGHYTNVNAFAYNNSGEIDIMRSTSCIGENPPVGATHLGLAHNGDLDRWDQISLNLSTPIVSGANYDLSFWVDMVQYTTQAEGNIEFGISNTSTSFGTLVHTTSPPLADLYVQYSVSITAPVGGNYLTIRPQATGATNRCWMHIDGIELIGEPLPFCDVVMVNTDTMIMPVDTFSDYTLAAETDIVLTGSILAGSGVDTFADLRAGGSITLNGPFEVELGTRTAMYIANCDPSNLTFKQEDDDELKRKVDDGIKKDAIKIERDYNSMVPSFK